MPFSLDDMLERLGLAGQKRGREQVREESASIQTRSEEEIKKLFPNVTLSQSKEIVYAPFRFCHSLPKVNLRGRSFTPRVMANSMASMRDAMINVDHQMNYRGNQDTICGHIVCGRFDPDGKYSTEVANSVPEEPIPLLALAAFHLRSQYIPNFLDEHLSGRRKWFTSMECNHDWDDAAFWYEKEIIPIKDADPGMRECVQKLAVKPYKGKDLALLLGGEKGIVDYHAAAITPSPADNGASLIAFVTNHDYVEAANKDGNKTSFFFPLEIKKLDGADPEELGNISVIGRTGTDGEGGDGHTHEVLSDGTIMPTNGHTHSLSGFQLVRGTTPRLTGKTDTHYTYFRDANQHESSIVHLHMIDIPLRGKTAGASEPEPEPATEAASMAFEAGAEYFPVLVPFLNMESDMTVKLDDLLRRMNSVLSAGKFEGQAATDLASLRTDISKFNQDTMIKDMVAQEIANQIKEGAIVPKTEHEKSVADAVKEAEAKAAADAAAAAKKQARREKVLAAGLDLDASFNEKIEMTLGQYADSFSLDESGDKLFEASLFAITSATQQAAAAAAATQAAAAAAAQPAAQAAAANGQAVPTGTETVVANAGGTPVKQRKMLLAGGGGGAAVVKNDEEANTGKKIGKHIFSSVN